jgi:NAD(P)-dependent dehydrogenase (short-subunit alcohol dehydrogenase family)
MVFDLRGKKVVVIGGKDSVGRAIAEAVAREGGEAVIWLRKFNDEVNGSKALPVTKPKAASQLPHEAAPASLWRQTMALKSYW